MKHSDSQRYETDSYYSDIQRKRKYRKALARSFFQNIPNLEVIVVDDNSPDHTADTVKILANTYSIHLIERAGKFGIGSAYITGFKKALELSADMIFEMDADLSHDPDDVPRMLEAAQHADLVIGSRKIAGGKIIGWGKGRKAISAGAMWLSRTALGIKAKDVTAGFRCFRRKVLESIDLTSIHSNGYAFQEEILFRTQQKGFRIMEIPVTFIDRREGRSKLSKKDIIEFFLTILRLKWKK